MKNISIITILALFLGSPSFAIADHHSGGEHQETEAKLKYLEFSEMGNPAEVIKVKEYSPQPLKLSLIHI